MAENCSLNVFEDWESLRHSSKPVIDAEAKLDYAEYKGFKQAFERGFQRGVEQANKEIIHSGIKLGYDVSTLAVLIGYSEERVHEIIEGI